MTNKIRAGPLKFRSESLKNPVIAFIFLTDLVLYLVAIIILIIKDISYYKMVISLLIIIITFFITYYKLFTYKTTKTAIDTERKAGTAYPLLSGGIDSAVATLIAKEKFEDVQPIFINRGQRAYKKEREAVEKICKLLGIKPAKEINVPFEWYIEAKKKDPQAFPFGRNLVLLSVAASYVAINGGGTIITGFTGDDVGDASEEFVETFNENLRYAIDDNINLEVVRVEAPLIKISKAQVIRLAHEKGREDILENTWSCYESGEEYGGLHCGLCSNCKKRKKAFKKSGLKDPTNYKN